MSNEQVASELLNLPADQREFWLSVLLGGGAGPGSASQRAKTPSGPGAQVAIGELLADASRDPELRRHLESELMKLPRQVRQRIADLLLESLAGDQDEPPSSDLEEEAHRRRLEMEGGAAEGIDWEVARVMLRARFGP